MSSKSTTKYKSVINKLKDSNKINDSILVYINSISLEDIIALKLELSSRNLKHRMFGLDIWHGMGYVIREAVLKFAIGATKSKKDAARFLGMDYYSFLKLVKKYKIKEFFDSNRNF